MSNPNLYLRTEWLHEKGILSYTIFSVSKTMMAQWSEQIIQDIINPESGSTVRLLFDLSQPNVSMPYFILAGRKLFNAGITAEGREQFIDTLERHSDTQFKLAVLLSHTMLGAMGKHVPEKYDQNNFSAKVFFDIDDAEQWLVAENTESDSKTSVLPTKELDDSLEQLGTQDLDLFGNRSQLRLLVMGSLEVVSIAEDKPVIIGRGKGADLNVKDYGEIAKSVSRQHARIALNNGRLSITDLGSSNGTAVSGRVLESGQTVYVRRGDIIQLGMMELSVIF